MQRLAPRAAKAGAAAAAAAAATAGPASEPATENRSAPPPSSALDDAPAALADAAALVKEEMKAQGLLVSKVSDDGHEWLDCPSASSASWTELEQLVDLATSVASEPSVQQVILEKSRRQQTIRDSLSRMLPAPPQPDHSGRSSFELVGSSECTSGSAPSELHASELTSSPTLSELVCAEEMQSTREATALLAENRALREENASLKGRLGISDASTRPPIPRLQALTRGVLARNGFYFPPHVACRISACESESHGAAATAAPRLVRLSFSVEGGCSPEPKPDSMARGGHPRMHAEGSTNMPDQRLVIACAIVVGMLALALVKNPTGARTLAAGAATTVAALLSRRGSAI